MNRVNELIIPKIALLLSQKKDLILQNWTQMVINDQSFDSNSDLEYLKFNFGRLLDDFAAYLSNDYINCYTGNLTIARNIAYNNIEYSKLIRSFFLFRESCNNILSQSLKPAEFVKCYNILDKLHQKSISIIANTYFEFKDSTAFALVKLTELRDPQTGYHVERTREYAFLLSNRLGCSSEFVNQIYKAAPLHDIGKVGIKDSILLKPGRLTKKEYEEMKKHTRIGAKTINDIINSQSVNKGYLLMGRDIALYHHEKYDGSGYPEGVSGENIPFCARIFAVADAYDTIVSERPYKKAFTHEEAVKRICKDSGTHFDPIVVNAFTSLETEFEMINNSLNHA
jgi:HD-GYP domain-containing protein (c-di-GMP phosphodiesterase class II)